MNRTDRLYALVEELRARAPRPMRASDLLALQVDDANAAFADMSKR